MKRVIFTAALLLFVTVSVTAAQQSTAPDTLDIGNVPEQYIVQKGDTLWDISERFLGNPLNWPDVWKKNPFIKDPHWIYPGQTLMLKAMIEKALEITPAPKVESVEEKYEPKPVEKPEPLFLATAPRIPDSLEVSLTSPGKSASSETGILQKLRSPRPVYTEKNFLRTGFITQRSELPKGEIIAIEEGKSSATKFDVVAIDVGSDDGVKNGDIFAAIKVGDAVKHPETGRNLGVVVRVKGVLKVISTGPKQARCQITENFDPILKGDLYMPYRISSGPKFDAWVKPNVSITGMILAIHESMLSVHINDILYIDKGSVDGVRPGDRFVIYPRSNTGGGAGHATVLGELEAINVMTNDTAVIVVSLKGEQIEIGDKVDLSARCRLLY
ncbi:LysM peptidoglycan-binding domain-containing protein [bacterium]|nr:LysM peptidoglycan-binding domain-containing protein [bacterium]